MGSSCSASCSSRPSVVKYSYPQFRDSTLASSVSRGNNDDDTDSIIAIEEAADPSHDIPSPVVRLLPTNTERWNNNGSSDDDDDDDNREWDRKQLSTHSSSYSLESSLRSAGRGYSSAARYGNHGGVGSGALKVSGDEENALIFTPDRPCSPIDSDYDDDEDEDGDERQDAPLLAVFKKLATSQEGSRDHGTALPISSTYPLSDEELQFSQTYTLNVSQVVPSSSPSRLRRRQHLSWFKVNSPTASRARENCSSRGGSVQGGSVRLNRSVTFVETDGEDANEGSINEINLF